MRILLFCILFPVGSFAQSLIQDSAFVRYVDLPSSEPFDTSNSWRKVKSPYVYIASGRDMYALFGYVISARYIDFDFSSSHILGKQSCGDCLLTCQHDEGKLNCHRNRCTYTWEWSVRDNKKAFSEIPFSAFQGHTGPGVSRRVYGDTVITHPSDSGLSRWFILTTGDRLARFYFKLYVDNSYPVVVLQEIINYGGSRAGGFWDNTIVFRKPEKVCHFIKNKIPVN